MMYINNKTEQVLEEILDNMDDDGHYPVHKGDSGYFQTKGKVGDIFVAFNNITCDCWVEEFETEQEAIDCIEKS